jgi:hypothetical protein
LRWDNFKIVQSPGAYFQWIAREVEPRSGICENRSQLPINLVDHVDESIEKGEFLCRKHCLRLISPSQ